MYFIFYFIAKKQSNPNSIAKYDDWVLYLTINNLEYEQARRLELHIKKMKSKKYIQNLKKFSEMQTKLIEKFKT